MTTIQPLQDPSRLTLEFVHREVLLLRDNLTDVIAANEKAALGQHLFMLDKIASVVEAREKHFAVVEAHRIEQKSDTQNAVQAALMAAKEAVLLQTTASERNQAKQDSATTKQLEQMGAAYATGIENLKERVTRMESGKVGGDAMKASFFALAGAIASVVGIVFYFIGKG